MPSLQKGGEYANAQPYPLIQYPRTDAYLSVGIAWVQYTAVARALAAARMHPRRRVLAARVV